MPKIPPETKVLIIKRLKTRSTADVADTFNVSQRQVQRFKNLTGDIFDKPGRAQTPQDNCSRGPFVGSKIQGQPFSTAADPPRKPGHLKSLCQPNSLSDSVSKWPPWSKSVPRSQHKKKGQLKKNCVAFAKAHSLLKGWMLEKVAKGGFFR
ncbi:hypothetical protein QQF64_019560 [Cirrhinus molitorella]|uniref:HTH psq-type domain-containing protein n=1 Tax=Cirrhinus molitorella TaxID=172907 RepID=A0ABR3LFT6_9TELE